MTSSERGSGVRITEPTTMLTDYALAVLAAGCAVSLWRRPEAGAETAVLLWGTAFAASAAAALAGGTVHGFALHLGEAVQRRLWKGTLFLIGVGSFCMLAAAIVAVVPGWTRHLLLSLAALKLLAYAAGILTREDFAFALYDYAGSLLALAGLLLFGVLRGGVPGAGWIGAGIVVSFVAAGVQQSGWRAHRHLNHNDLFHLVQMGALYLFYRGGLLLQAP
jgi:hypothetical protein